MHSASAATDSPVARPLAVSYRPTASLVPDPRNARTHPKRQIEQIVASIRAFGFTNPILADPEGRLIAGHGRLLAAKQIGLAEVPVIELAGLSEAQKKALRLADNKIALNAGWDLEILKLELSDLSLPEFDMDLSLTGGAVKAIASAVKLAVIAPGHASPAPTSQSVSLLQLLARGDPAGGAHVRSVPAVAAERRGSAVRARHRHLS
jgi:hypothetical protein